MRAKVPVQCEASEKEKEASYSEKPSYQLSDV